MWRIVFACLIWSCCISGVFLATYKKDCQVGAWGPWGPCLGNCDFGLKVRNRDVLTSPFPKRRPDDVWIIQPCPQLYQVLGCLPKFCSKDPNDPSSSVTVDFWDRLTPVETKGSINLPTDAEIVLDQLRVPQSRVAVSRPGSLANLVLEKQEVQKNTEEEKVMSAEQIVEFVPSDNQNKNTEIESEKTPAEIETAQSVEIDDPDHQTGETTGNLAPFMARHIPSVVWKPTITRPRQELKNSTSFRGPGVISEPLQQENQRASSRGRWPPDWARPPSRQFQGGVALDRTVGRILPVTRDEYLAARRRDNQAASGPETNSQHGQTTNQKPEWNPVWSA